MLGKRLSLRFEVTHKTFNVHQEIWNVAFLSNQGLVSFGSFQNNTLYGEKACFSLVLAVLRSSVFWKQILQAMAKMYHCFI